MPPEPVNCLSCGAPLDGRRRIGSPMAGTAWISCGNCLAVHRVGFALGRPGIGNAARELVAPAEEVARTRDSVTEAADVAVLLSSLRTTRPWALAVPEIVHELKARVPVMRLTGDLYATPLAETLPWMTATLARPVPPESRRVHAGMASISFLSPTELVLEEGVEMPFLGFRGAEYLLGAPPSLAEVTGPHPGFTVAVDHAEIPELFTR